MKASGLVVVLVTLAGSAIAGQDPLAAAKDLYAAASYEEALSTLSRLAQTATPDVAGQIDQYRAFSLFALGRTTEAEKVAETFIRSNPLARLNEGEASPRIEAMFAAVRKRVLPSVIRDEYRTARAAIDRKDLKTAEPHLRMVSRMLNEARSSGEIDETLTDLSLIVDGFLGLSQASAQQAAPAATAAARPAAANSSAPVLNPAMVVYSGTSDPRLVPPVAISQNVPDMPSNVSDIMRRGTRKPVVLELTINERGDVQDAAVIESSEPLYDQLVLRAARQWKYRPATRDGVPVKFRRSVAVAFQDQ